MNDSLQIFCPIPCLCNKVDDLKRVRKRSLHFSGLRKRRGLCKEDLKKAALCFLIELSVWNRLAKFQSMQLFSLLITQLFNFTKWLHFQQKTAFLKCFELLLFEHCDVWCSLFATRLLQHPKGIQPSNEDGSSLISQKRVRV